MVGNTGLERGLTPKSRGWRIIRAHFEEYRAVRKDALRKAEEFLEIPGNTSSIWQVKGGWWGQRSGPKDEQKVEEKFDEQNVQNSLRNHKIS